MRDRRRALARFYADLAGTARPLGVAYPDAHTGVWLIPLYGGGVRPASYREVQAQLERDGRLESTFKQSTRQEVE